MTLISLLLVLALDRLTTKSDVWRSETYMLPYLNAMQNRGWLYVSGKSWQVYVAVMIPTMLSWAVYQSLPNLLFTIVLNLVLLFIAVGCPHIRAKFKGYLQASNRGDFAARDLYAEQLRFQQEDGFTFGQHMVWINFRYYFAIAFWFLILGGTGAVLYLSARLMESQAKDEGCKLAAGRILAILDFLPVRLASLGFLLVGDFRKGIGLFTSYLVDVNADAKSMLLNIAKACEEIEVEADDCTDEPCTMLKLAKRNMVLLLAVMSVLTLGGWLL